MSIATKTGDDGMTSLMYNRRVSKCHPRVEAYAGVDELNAALGVARSTSEHEFVRSTVFAIQQDLVILMGELATSVEDLGRYVKDGFSLVSPEMTLKLDQLVEQIEAQQVTYSGWATPGSSLPSATLDLARTVCRRAERSVCALQNSDRLQNREIIVYLNRLSDVLWLLARWVETENGKRPDLSPAESNK